MVSHADIAAVPSCSRAVSPAFSHPILTVISALIRRRKIIERLSIARGNGACVSIWHDSTTCLLASVYIVIPLLLFRIQDKTAAISETSPFAAIIVAFSYDQIIAGKDSRTKTPRAGRSDARHERGSPATKRVDKRDDDTGGNR